MLRASLCVCNKTVRRIVTRQSDLLPGAALRAGAGPPPPPSAAAAGVVAAPQRAVAPTTPPAAVGGSGGGVTPKKKIIKKIIKKRRVATPVSAQPPAGATASAAVVEASRAHAPDTSEASQHEAAEPRSVCSPDTPAFPEPRPPAAATPAAPRDPDTAGSKTAMVKAYKIEEVLSMCTEEDAIFARRLPSGGCQFFAWPGTPISVASAAITSMPTTIRTVHAIFGRINTPIDLVMDIDCPVPEDHWSMSKIRPFQLKLLDDVLTVVTAELEKLGEKIETQVILQSPNLKKASFHVHTKLRDAAFEDYNSLCGFLHTIHEKIPSVDLQIYRPNGMLRMFGSMKENHTSAMVVFDDPKWNIGFPDGKVPDEAAALHSVCIREPGTFTRRLHFDAPRLNAYMPSFTISSSAATAADGAGSEAPRRLIPVLLPRTAREAVENASNWLRQATEVEVGEWRTWIGLGLCAYRVGYHFRDTPNLPKPALQEMLDAWAEASRKCPNKYHNGECEMRWASFDPSKLGDQGEGQWWYAYQRLGRLNVPAEAAIALEEAKIKERDQRFKKTEKADVGAAKATKGVSGTGKKQQRH